MTTAFLTPAELAEALGLSTSTLKRWSDKGLLPVARTAGKHRRIALKDALRFVRDARLRVVVPHRLGLPSHLPEVDLPPRAHADLLYEALAAGRTEAANDLVFSLFMAGTPPAVLADDVMRPALERVGELWTEGAHGIATEHAATDCLLRAVAEIRALIEAPADAPLAVGAAPSGDPYWLPSALAALTLADAGFRTLNLGPDTPEEALLAAIERHRPALVWLSLSRPPADANAEARLEASLRMLAGRGATVVLGGRGAPATSRAARALATCGDLADFARGLLAALPAKTDAPAGATDLARGTPASPASSR